jgi:cobalamin-dependent methionine synthase I
MALFADRKAAVTKQERPAEVEARLKQRIIDGDRQGLEADPRTSCRRACCGARPSSS